MDSSAFLTLPLCLLSFIASLHVSATIVLEDGYTVTTVIEGHKLEINPHSVLQLAGSSDLLVLDSANSVFYIVDLPLSQDSVFKRFSGSGDGSGGYSDGDVGSARFNKPRSFAVDLNGNVYVADRNNNVIRKISSSGVTTIAGGISRNPGRKDGPAQNATFSEDFELAFVPSRCILLVSDHGNQLIRQIHLKKEDCTPQAGLGAALNWPLGIGFLLLGILLGIIFSIIFTTVVRPRFTFLEGLRPLVIITTWKHCLMNLGKIVVTICFAIRSAAVSSNISSSHTVLKKLWSLSLSHLLLMLRINKVASPGPYQEHRPLIDLDSCHCEVTESSKYDDQLKDLIGFDGKSDVFSECNEDDNIEQADDMGFAETAKDRVLVKESYVRSYGLVKRR